MNEQLKFRLEMVWSRASSIKEISRRFIQFVKFTI